MNWRAHRSTAITVRGATLAGIAASLRLARVGHAVTLVDAGFGGHWTTDCPEPASSLPGTLSLRAAWMDLLRKSGRPFDAELARHGLSLVPAPPTRHRFADGLDLALPDERGAQQHAIAAAFGEGPAQRWCDLLDDADRLWQRLRADGLERPAPERLTRAERRDLWAGRDLDWLAARLGEPHLASIVRDLGPLAGAGNAGAPALLVSRASVDRRFSRWHLADAVTGLPRPTGDLFAVLRERLDVRGVHLGTQDPGDADAVVDCAPAAPDGRWARALARPAWAPAVRRFSLAASDLSAADLPSGERFAHLVDHTDSGPVVRWTARRADGTAEILEHDHTRRRRDLAWGLAPDSWRAWVSRPGLRVPGADAAWRASASSPGGNEPWAELLSAALVVYDVHARLTGEDIRPANRDYRP